MYWKRINVKSTCLVGLGLGLVWVWFGLCFVLVFISLVIVFIFIFEGWKSGLSGAEESVFWKAVLVFPCKVALIN